MSDRIHSIDTLRAVAIGFVVVAHAGPFKGYGQYGNHVFFVLDTVGQFDVPFFFAVSGFFLATKISPDNALNTVVSSAKKLATLYGFGIMVYAPVLFLGVAGLAKLEGRSVQEALVAKVFQSVDPIHLLYYGDAFAEHLWFLTSLIFSFVLVGVFVVSKKESYLLPAAALLHLTGILDQNFPLLFDVPAPTRDAVFFGFFYVVLGYKLQTIDWRPDTDRSTLYLALVLVLVIVQLLEQYILGYVLRDATLAQEVVTTPYTVSTTLFVAAVLVYALSAPDLGKKTLLPTVGTYAVGVYLIHFPIDRLTEAIDGLMYALAGIDLSTMLWWHVLLVPGIYAISLATYLALDRVGVIDIGESHVPRMNRIRRRLGAVLGSVRRGDAVE
jgi:surface polysaccharide O-acyltransferase-like enzyme